jgi:signal transduction histidine kinase
VDLARVEQDGVRFEPQVFAPARIFDRVVRRHEHEAHERGIRVASGVEPGADQIHGDPHRLEQVVENLVANALRYVPDGGTIALSAWTADGAAHVSVIDDGPGLPPEHLPRLFDRFYKADAARVASGAGSGLGLSIVKAIVERHGGTVAVTSRPGRTAFHVTLPGAAIVSDAQPANL